jgi:ApaG protein
MHKTEFNPALVGVNIVTTYLPSHSNPEESHYTFAYTITISNAGDAPVQLRSRHWIITDGNNEVQEVRGEGVVGEQPIIEPGESFRYTSGATLATPVGYMEGSYFMVVREPMDVNPVDLPTFTVAIPAFTLHTPTALN